jgi:hypothetical protein
VLPSLEGWGPDEVAARGFIGLPEPRFGLRASSKSLDSASHGCRFSVAGSARGPGVSKVGTIRHLQLSVTVRELHDITSILFDGDVLFKK